MSLNERTPKVTVVVPVYNPGEGITRCIESLFCQTLDDIEVIFIDDRGDDDSMDRVRDAAQRDERVRIIENPVNMGPGPARNTGIENARGTYLSFVDPDDYVEPDYLERLVEAADSNGLDLVKGRIVYERNDGSVAPHYELNERIRAGIWKGAPLYATFTHQAHTALHRRSALMASGARYGSSRKAQDTTFLLRVCACNPTFDLVNNARYHFCERFSSTMHRLDEFMLSEELKSMEERMDFISKNLPLDVHALRYVSGMFLAHLRMQAYCAQFSQCAQASEAHLQDVRALLLSYELGRQAMGNAVDVRALGEFGVNLCTYPFALPWEGQVVRGWDNVLVRWVDFILAHPDCDNEYMEVLKTVFFGATITAAKARREGSTEDAAYLRGFIKQQKERFAPSLRRKIDLYMAYRMVREKLVVPPYLALRHVLLR